MMKSKFGIWSTLLIVCLGMSLGSCSKDDDNDDPNYEGHHYMRFEISVTGEVEKFEPGIRLGVYSKNEINFDNGSIKENPELNSYLVGDRNLKMFDVEIKNATTMTLTPKEKVMSFSLHQYAVLKDDYDSGKMSVTVKGYVDDVLKISNTETITPTYNPYIILLPAGAKVAGE